MPFANLGSFQSLLLRLLVPALSSFSSPSRTPNDTNVRSFVIVPYVLEEHFLFHPIFSLFGSGNFYCPFFKLVHWFFPLSSPFCCWAYPLSFFIFYFLIIVFFSSEFPFHFSLYLLFLPSDFLVFYVSSGFEISHWNIYVMSALKYLSDNSNFLFQCLFLLIVSSFIQNEIFLVLSMQSDFSNWNLDIWGITLWDSRPYLNLLV